MERYNKNKVINKNGKLVHEITKFPEIPLSVNDTYVITQEGDRLDILAKQFYNDSTLWFFIALANSNLSKNSITLFPGTQIRIPGNIEEIKLNYTLLNQ